MISWWRTDELVSDEVSHTHARVVPRNLRMVARMSNFECRFFPREIHQAMARTCKESLSMQNAVYGNVKYIVTCTHTYIVVFTNHKLEQLDVEPSLR